MYDIPLARFLKPDVPRVLSRLSFHPAHINTNIPPQLFYLSFVLQPWILLFLKASFFILYFQLFGNLTWARISSWIGLTFVVLAHVAFGITSLFIANPHEMLSWATPSNNMGVAIGCVGLVMDLAIFVIPYIAIAPLQLPRAKKIGVFLTFFTGIRCVQNLSH